MKAIYKYILEITASQTIMMPKNSSILCVQNQEGKICIWAIVDPDTPLTLTTFKIYGTGHRHKEISGKYLATVQIDIYVWHVFLDYLYPI